MKDLEEITIEQYKENVELNMEHSLKNYNSMVKAYNKFLTLVGNDKWDVKCYFNKEEEVVFYKSTKRKYGF